MEIERYGVSTYGEHEGTWVTVETRNAYVDGVGPLFFREKIRVPDEAVHNRELLATYITQYAEELAQRQANFIIETEKSVAQAALNESRK